LLTTVQLHVYKQRLMLKVTKQSTDFQTLETHPGGSIYFVRENIFDWICL